MSRVTDLQQARELRAAGLPPNLEVETRFWSRKTSMLMLAVDRAQAKFLDKVLGYNGCNDLRKYNAMVKAFGKLSDAVSILADHCQDLDDDEAVALNAVLQQQMEPVLDHFESVFERMGKGEAVSFHLGINNKPAVVQS